MEIRGQGDILLEISAIGEENQTLGPQDEEEYTKEIVFNVFVSKLSFNQL